MASVWQPWMRSPCIKTTWALVNMADVCGIQPVVAHIKSITKVPQKKEKMRYYSTLKSKGWRHVKTNMHGTTYTQTCTHTLPNTTTTNCVKRVFFLRFCSKIGDLGETNLFSTADYHKTVLRSWHNIILMSQNALNRPTVRE